MKTARPPKPPRVRRRMRRGQSDDARFRAALKLAAWVGSYVLRDA